MFSILIVLVRNNINEFNIDLNLEIIPKIKEFMWGLRNGSVLRSTWLLSQEDQSLAPHLVT